jgi:hypothetical protein
MTDRRLVKVLLASLLVVLGYGVGVTVNSTFSVDASSPSTTFHACLKGGLLSKVSASGVSCGSGYKLISWNEKGTQGIQGVRGVQGNQGNQGNPGTPATLPSGSYLVDSVVTSTCPDGYTMPLYVEVAGSDVPLTDSLGADISGCSFH